MEPFTIAGTTIAPGKRARVELEVARLYDFTRMNVPVEVIHGREAGPVLFVTAAIHGDEINGVEIVKRVLHQPVFSKLRGTLIAVPIANVYGFNARQRYLPDRRDLNRCFPGSEDGPLANQLAHALMEAVIRRSTHGIDLHTGAIHRTNLPHIRASLDNEEIEQFAASFRAPLVMHSGLRDGSLREAAREAGVPVLLFEGGEALRFNEPVIRLAVRGVLSAMRHIGMLPEGKHKTPSLKGKIARDSYWVRAPHSGMLTTKHTLGNAVSEGEVLGHVSDPFGQHRFAVVAKAPGVIIGMSMLPLFNEGDAMFNIATFKGEAAMHEIMEYQQQVLTGQTDTYVT